MNSHLIKSLLILTSVLLTFQFCQPMLVSIVKTTDCCKVSCPSNSKKPVKNERSCPAVLRCDLSNCCYTKPEKTITIVAAPLVRAAVTFSFSILSPVSSEIFQPPEMA
ncbi:hypothetical protein K1X84_12925 [bacterium]|nr:hypothetical protein [bacterium]